MNVRIRILAALAAAAPAAALAYLPPSSAILRREAQRREDARVSAMEVHGTLAFQGDDAQRVAAVLGAPTPGPELTVPALLLLKAPGRCRLELVPAGSTPATRPSVALRSGKVVGQRGLDTVPAARGLLEGVCALLADAGGSGPAADRAIASKLAAHGVALGDVALGRMDTRVAWIVGGRPTQPPRPQAWIDKATFQPIRLVASLGGTMRDVRLLDFGAPVGGEAFPRAVEVWSGPQGQLEARLTAEKVLLNPRLPDSAF